MSAVSKMKSLITGEDEVAPVFAKQRDIEQRLEANAEKRNKLGVREIELTAARKKAALLMAEDGDEGPYTKACAALDKNAVERAAADDAREALLEMLSQARAESHALGVQGLVKMQARLGGQKIKEVEKIETALAVVIEATEKLRTLNDKNLMAWPTATIGEAPYDAGILTDRRLQEALVGAITKLCPPNPINPSFVFPGASQDALFNPVTAPTLRQQFDEANAFLLRTIEGQPAYVEPEPVAKVNGNGHAAPTKPAHVELNTLAEEQPGERYTAAQAQAMSHLGKMNLTPGFDAGHTQKE